MPSRRGTRYSGSAGRHVGNGWEQRSASQTCLPAAGCDLSDAQVSLGGVKACHPRQILILGSPFKFPGVSYGKMAGIMAIFNSLGLRDYWEVWYTPAQRLPRSVRCRGAMCIRTFEHVSAMWCVPPAVDKQPRRLHHACRRDACTTPGAGSWQTANENTFVNRGSSIDFDLTFFLSTLKKCLREHRALPNGNGNACDAKETGV
jgi:hypothetical protein